MRLKVSLVISFLLLGLLFPSPVRADDGTTVNDIAKELVCQCGCGMLLSNCNHAGCPYRDPMMASIQQQLDQGSSKDQIIQSFVAQYGEQVLAAPPKRGFNLTAWVLPFAALVAGGGVLYFALRAWVRKGKRALATSLTETEEVDEDYQRRLEKELEEFEGGNQ